MKRRLLLLPILLAAALPAMPFEPAVDPDTGVLPLWPGGRAVMHYDAATIRGGYVDALASAMQTWSEVEGADFRFVLAGPSSAENVRSSRNGSSDCYFDPTLLAYAYAVTIMNFDGSDRITERDVAFNGNQNVLQPVRWDLKPSNSWSGAVDFETVALHELGHVLGLQHHGPDQKNVESVMNTTYQALHPAWAHRWLYPDDEAAVRSLYPASPPAGPDLAVTAVSFAEGERLEIRFTVANRGDEPSGSFAVRAHLTAGVVPRAGDPVVGQTAASFFLEPGESAAAVLEGEIPPSTPPGEYQVGVVVDAEGRVPDPNRENNALATAATIRVDRAPRILGPGDRVEDSIGPYGTDRFRVVLLGGTKFTVKGSMTEGTAALLLEGPEGSTFLSESAVKRRPKLAGVVPETGEHTLRLASGLAGITDYRLKIRAKPLRGATETTGPARIPIPAYAGFEVLIRLSGRNGVPPVAVVEGLEVPAKAKRNRLTLGPFAAPATGELVLVVSTPARVRWRAR